MATLTRAQRRARARARVQDARRNPGRAMRDPIARVYGEAVALDANPNRAKRHLPTHVRDPREAMRLAPGTGGQGTSGTTGYSADPRYVSRYGARATAERAERNTRTGETTGGATVDYRNRRRVPIAPRGEM